MSGPAQRFHLFADALSAISAPKRPEPIEVPPGVSYIAVKDGQLTLSPGAPVDPEGAHVVEPLLVGHRPQLLLLTPSEHRTRVNGHPAPRVAVLHVKDQVQIADDVVLHVTLLNKPQIGPPPAEVIGKECPVCRVPFTPDTSVYVCHGCGMALHGEGEEKGDDRLECVRLSSECPICQAPVIMASGYDYFPDL